MKTNILFTIGLSVSLLLLSSCDFKVSTNSGNKTVANIETVNDSAQKIRNQIQFKESGGLHVENAFLMLEDGTLVSEDNTIKKGERVKLILKLSGWKADDGKVEIGAGQQLLSSDERLILREPDLFEKNSIVSDEDAKVITLTMEVLNTETIYDFYQTDFKVWNKKADQSVYGSYRFKIK